MERITLCLIGLFILFIGCINDQTTTTKSTSEKQALLCEITVISPYGCYQQVDFNELGFGQISTGLKDGEIMDPNVRMDTVIVIDSFHITNVADRDSLYNITKRIKSMPLHKGNRKEDAYRVKISIDGVLKVDEYGTSITTFELFKLLIKYLPNHEQCEFFGLIMSRKTG